MKSNGNINSVLKFTLILFVFCGGNLFTQNNDLTVFKKKYEIIHQLEVVNKDSAIKGYTQLLKELLKLPPNKITGTVYHRLAELSFKKNKDVTQYLDYNFKGINILESSGDSLLAMNLYQNLGTFLSKEKRFQEALLYYRKAFRYAKRNSKSQLLLFSGMAIADNYSEMDMPDSAILILTNLDNNFPKDLTIEEHGILYTNIANTYANKAEVIDNSIYYKKIIEYADKAIKLYSIDLTDSTNLSYAYGLLGIANSCLGNFDEAEMNYNKAIKIVERFRDYYSLQQFLFEMTQLQIKKGNKENALNYFKKHDSLSQQIYNNQNSESISEMKTLFETEKKEEENKLLQTENKLSMASIKQQKLVIVFSLIGLLLVGILAFFIFNGLKKQKRANVIISEQKQIVEEQKHLVEEHQKEILDSIHYAKRIQSALLANEELVRSHLPDSFVLFKPKDIVSGDFYWAAEHNNKFYLAICDSTGHGVPGAFMSLLNMGFLSEAIKEKNIEKPNEVFNFVRSRLESTISNEGQKDGMDGILICIDNGLSIRAESRTITYSAANNEPILIRENSIIELTKDRMPVGKGEKSDSFTLNTIELKKGEILYLYTDGYADQFGGPKGKKFKYKQLNELLLANVNLPMLQQAEILNNTLEEWKGNLEQVDDICIIGIRF